MMLLLLGEFQPFKQVISNASSSNRLAVVDTIYVLRNAHSRRKFAEVIDNLLECFASVENGQPRLKLFLLHQ